ncbi:hypothetical protein B5X24_HaOG207692 [Helicoverpa armigera]|uniref:Uncharacterized protein n=1 Tax=Helicoverpa armigera TaxID=29058 RepID=A0A2W1BLI9_HELAM|nr:hypothetical protein B5X24_HaOG207692 [Helicoverpa armigera]
MALCMNCNIRIHANQQYDYDALSMSPEIVSILEEWITRQVTDGDRICQQCMNLILTELNNRNENNIGGRQLGHQSVCVWCGISISRRTGRRSRPLTDDHPEWAYVAGIISPRQIPPNGRACNACWQRAHSNILQVIEPPRESQETSDNVESRSSSVAAPVSTFISEIDMDIVQNDNVLVELEGYSRTPNSSNHCFVPDCTNSERLRVPIYIKQQILMDYKLYVSPNARVCEEHASVYNWELLTEYQFTTQFTQSHIVEMLDLLRKKNSKNYWLKICTTIFVVIGQA